jgi:hypothetical protein
MALPSPSPSAGSFVAPKTTVTMTKIMTNSPIPSPNGMDVSFVCGM